MKHIIQCFMLISFFGISMSGCSNGIFNTEPFVDSHHDEKGNVVLEDTPENWELYIFSVDSKISKEAAGKAPEADMKSWNDYWLFRMQAIPANRENRDKYVNYISDRRRQEGLPELEVYSEQVALVAKDGWVLYVVKVIQWIHTIELHWYEAPGIGRKEYKIKYLLE